MQKLRPDLFNDKHDERTGQRLLEIKEMGLTELGIAEFGIKGKMSGLYIERIWNFTDKEWDDYIQWIKSLSKTNIMLRFIITISNTQYPLYPVQMNIETATHVAAQHAFNKMRHVFEDLGLQTKGTGFTFSVWFSDGSVLTYTMRQNHAMPCPTGLQAQQTECR